MPEGPAASEGWGVTLVAAGDWPVRWPLSPSSGDVVVVVADEAGAFPPFLALSRTWPPIGRIDRPPRARGRTETRPMGTPRGVLVAVEERSENTKNF